MTVLGYSRYYAQGGLGLGNRLLAAVLAREQVAGRTRGLRADAHARD
jgi:hypothetical protein